MILFGCHNLLHFFLQELDVAIVKATNHVERPAKEKHIRGELVPLSIICSFITRGGSIWNFIFLVNVPLPYLIFAGESYFM